MGVDGRALSARGRQQFARSGQNHCACGQRDGRPHRQRERMNWDQAQNLLCVRLDSLGDVLMTTPAIRALKHSAPGRRITLLTSPSGAKAGRLVPEIDAVIEFRAPWMKPATE